MAAGCSEPVVNTADEAASGTAQSAAAPLTDDNHTSGDTAPSSAGEPVGSARASASADESAPVAEAGSAAESSGTTPDLEAVGSEIQEALDAALTYTDEQKDEYLSDLRQRLDKIDRSFDQIQRQAETLSTEARQQWQERWNELDRERQDIRQRLRDVADSGADAWQELRTGVEEAWRELRDAVNNGTP
jgi:chromosome segregation ATPase